MLYKEQQKKLKKILKDQKIKLVRLKSDGGLTRDLQEGTASLGELIFYDKLEGDLYGKMREDGSIIFLHAVHGHPIRTLRHLSRVVGIRQGLDLAEISYTEIPSREQAYEITKKIIVAGEGSHPCSLDQYFDVVLGKDSLRL